MDFQCAKTSTTIKIDIPQGGTFDNVDHIQIPHSPASDQARSTEELLAFSSFAVFHSILAGMQVDFVELLILAEIYRNSIDFCIPNDH